MTRDTQAGSRIYGSSCSRHHSTVLRPLRARTAGQCWSSAIASGNDEWSEDVDETGKPEDRPDPVDDHDFE
jgi:hypothetical protein